MVPAAPRHRSTRRAPAPPVIFALAVAATLSPTLRADDAAPAVVDRPVTRAEHERALDEIADLRRVLEGGAPATLAGDGSSRLPGGKGGLYDKPFLERMKSSVSLGGYFDVEYRDPEGAPHDFRFHRLIPFIYADIHERVRFATEIEIEDGSDVAIEFAYVDLLIVDEINFRGGVILDPLGKFNLIHDSPINDLTDRPLVNQFVIPTTLREVGAGFFGDLTPDGSDCEVKYEVYLTSGFKGLDDAGMTTITSGSGLRGARPHSTAFGTSRFDDINNKFAGVGRLSVSPLLGSELGISAHSGAYDAAGDNLLTTTAVDGLVTIPGFELAGLPVGPIELQGEGAYSFVERDSFARTSGVADDIWGYYVQANWHFMPRCFVDGLPLVFLPQSTFTLVGRWDQVDLDGNRMRRATIGLNFRPTESTVFKLDYQFNQGTGTAPVAADVDAFVFSIASYF